MIKRARLDHEKLQHFWESEQKNQVWILHRSATNHCANNVHVNMMVSRSGARAGEA